ncbi:hypothetical protein [Blastococcus sp. SYSU DS1024]
MQATFHFPAAEMSTPIAGALCLSAGDRSSGARRALEQGGFDQAPVLDDGRLVGWVRLKDLGGRGFVASSVVPLDKTVVLARSASVGDALDHLAHGHLIFLAGSSGIVEFVVVSDLDRHIVRSYLYVLLSAVEFRLAELAKRHLDDEQIVRNFQGQSRSRYRRARAKGRETRAVEYLYLLDYARIGKLIPELQSSEWVPGDQEWDLVELNVLRNCVAHPSKSLTGDFDAAEVSRLAARANDILRCLKA